MRRGDRREARGDRKKNPALLISLCLLSCIYCVGACSAAERGSAVSIDRSFLDGGYDKVVSDTTRLINARSSKSDELYYARGLANLKLNKFDVARNDFNAILSKYPRSVRRFDAYMGIGDSYFLEGNFDEAARSYEEMPGKFTGNKNISSVYYKIGCSYRETGSNARADEYFEKAKKLAPLSFESRMIPAPQNRVRRTAEPGFEARTAEPGFGAASAKSGGFSVQVGSFRNKENADKLSRKLAQEGYSSHVDYAEASADGMYRVKIGNYNFRNEAESMASTLRGHGYSTKICSGDASQ